MPVPSLTVQIQGQMSVSADNLNTFTQVCDTAATLRTFTGVAGMQINLQGIQTRNDGNGGAFFWSASGTTPDDNYTYITPNGNTVGQWVRLNLPTTNANLSAGVVYPTGSSTPYTLAQIAALAIAGGGGGSGGGAYGLPVTGAVFDGTTSDTAAWNAVYATAAGTPQGGARIIVPPGSRIYTPGTVNYGAGLNVVDLNGAYQGTSSVYSTLNGQGSDLLISEHSGGLNWTRNKSNSNEQPILVMTGTTSNGGTGQPGLMNIFHTIASSATTTTAPGSLIIQTGNYSNAETFSSLICVGTKNPGGNADCITTNFRAVDATGGNSSVGGGLVVSEFDLNAQGIDNGGGPSGLNPGYGVRIGLQVLVRKPTGATSVEAAHALLVGGGNAQTYPNPDLTQWCKLVVAATGSVTMAAFDTTTAYMLATASNPLPDAYRMAAGQAIGFDGVTNSPLVPMQTPHQLLYNSSAGAGQIQFTNAGAVLFAIDNTAGLIGSVQATGGTVPRLMSARAADRINVLDYASVQAAVTAAVGLSYNPAVYIPNGVYAESGAITGTTAAYSMSIQGDGGATINFAAAVNGFVLSANNPLYSVGFSGAVINSANAAGSPANTAISFNSPNFASGSIPRSTEFKNTSITGGWLNGVVITGVPSFFSENIQVLLSDTTSTAVALTIQGIGSGGISTKYAINDWTIKNGGTAISIGNYIQGVDIKNLVTLGTTIGVQWLVTATGATLLQMEGGNITAANALNLIGTSAYVVANINISNLVINTATLNSSPLVAIEFANFVNLTNCTMSASIAGAIITLAGNTFVNVTGCKISCATLQLTNSTQVVWSGGSLSASAVQGGGSTYVSFTGVLFGSGSSTTFSGSGFTPVFIGCEFLTIPNFTSCNPICIGCIFAGTYYRTGGPASAFSGGYQASQPIIGNGVEIDTPQIVGAGVTGVVTILPGVSVLVVYATGSITITASALTYPTANSQKLRVLFKNTNTTVAWNMTAGGATLTGAALPTSVTAGKAVDFEYEAQDTTFNHLTYV